MRIGGRQSNAQFQYTIQGDTLDDLVQWGPILLQEMKNLPGFTDVDSDQKNNGLQMSLVIDRYGLFGMEVHDLSGGRIAGAALMVGGIVPAA